ncbi:MAG: carboxypeptidase-like regulatory domain-containing protein, partial [Planctomycetota bacterium]
AGEFKIRVSDEGFRLHEETLHFSANSQGSEEPLKFILPQNLVWVEGRLLLGQKPISGAQVKLKGPHQIVRKTPADESGRFRFSGLPVQGPFQVEALWTDPEGIPWKAASKVDAPVSDLALQLQKDPESR